MKGFLYVLILLQIVAGLVTSINFVQLRNQAEEGRQAHDTQCAIREDIRKRRADAVQFLKEHPNGIVTNDGSVLISAEQIQNGIKNNESTLASMVEAGLNCEESNGE